MLDKTAILSKAKYYLGIGQSDTTHDTDLNAFIDMSVRAIENYTGRELTNASYSVSEKFYMTKRDIYVPRNYTPILTISSAEFMQIEYNHVRLIDDYELLAIYALEFTYGFASRLEDIEDVAVWMTVDFWKRRGANGLHGIESKSSNTNMSISESNYLRELIRREYADVLKPYYVAPIAREWR